MHCLKFKTMVAEIVNPLTDTSLSIHSSSLQLLQFFKNVDLTPPPAPSPYCIFLKKYVHRDYIFLTSEANESRFFSPPDMPVTLPGIPIIVSAHFVRPSCSNILKALHITVLALFSNYFKRISSQTYCLTNKSPQ